MKKPLLLLSLGATLLFGACSKKDAVIDDTTPPVVTTPSNTVSVSGDITTNTTWTADKIYTLSGFVYVTNGATLTIEPGTIIKGDKATKGTLIITRGAKIEAVGTADKPIVFTSSFAAGTRNAGDWGGIILLGKAPVNQGENVGIEGGLDAKGDAAKYIQYGGNVANDNSGTLKYVRIEYAGIPFSPDNEINGLTMGGVGSGTTIDYVMVYRSGDDAFEWFGGTVNAKHLLAIGSVDDDFDTDFGFAGKVQFGISQRYPTVADVSGSNAFESDNDGSGSDKTPQTSAVFSNMTLVGPVIPTGAATTIPSVNANYQHAAQIRRNSGESILNSVFAGFVDGIYIDDSKVTTAASTSTNFTAGRLVFTNNIIGNIRTAANEVKGENKSLFEATLRANNTFNSTLNASTLLTDPFKYSSDFANAGIPVFTVKAGSVAETGAAFTNAKVADTFFERVTYRGAMGSTDWTANWTNFNPQATLYTTPGATK
ncbi:hypothetical protein FPZ43_10460 [Mucilaginibacter pallidiroseus]|uniref:T9SS C-terminal target domain-containing protein n=1 Tax=Mucilaginibacter pallidiroseus TaxID=2599295 RepID=A0A563UDL4_9SPHI|nr:hypothetical protein [Mucilaginibacter pallidiroseus]TWR29369.1 hypothetical protein FPZ43_10460 [Mucilaginibacter pallidiroseus]